MIPLVEVQFFKARAVVLVSLFGLLIFYSFAPALQKEELLLQSPDRKVNLRIQLSKGHLSYSVTYWNKTAIELSPLGIVRQDQDFSTQLKLMSQKESSFEESYSLMVGKKLQCKTAGRELILTFQNRAAQKMQVIFRAYNHGIAYGYHFPDKTEDLHRIEVENSGFAFKGDTKAWIQPYDMNVRKKPCYETYYENGVRLDSLPDVSAGWAFPALFRTNDLWVLITEAGVDPSYPATHLHNKTADGLFTIRFPEATEVISDADPHPVSGLPWTTPWRAAIIGHSLSDIQESTLVTDLNPPTQFKDVSWIKPGRSSWSWWSAGASPKDFEVQKAYVDFTSSMGWEYVLIDSGWPQMKNGSMEELVRYANEKNVGIVLWYHSGLGREKDTLSYANVMAFPEERRKEFQKIRTWGVKGVKVDFFDSDKQPVIKRYFEILDAAADAQIMVNFHGSTLPRGWERTYPHLMSMESVKGAEGAGRQEFCDRAPSHNTILPYTRNVVGPMDYTPVTFTNKREAIRRTSFGHELALAVVFESGVFHFADNMNSYNKLPDGPRNFLKQVPTAWDETRYVAAEPGKFSVVARRKGDAWYIAGISGLPSSQQITFDLNFLSNDLQLTLITDGPEAGTFSTAEMSVAPKGNVITIAPHGGFVLYQSVR
jgi:alpha-glucosidase